MAIGASCALHLAFVASQVPWSAPADEVAEVSSFVLVPVLTRAPPPPEPQPPSLEERPPAPPEPRQRPLLASLINPTVVPSPVDSRLEPEPPPELLPEPPPELLPEITLPPARDAARRQLALDVPPEPTEQQQVEATVLGLMREALPPRTNDVSPMPELRIDDEGNLVHQDGALRAVITPDGSVYFGRRRGVSVDGFRSKSPDPGEQAIRDLHTQIPGLPIPLAVSRASPGDCAAGRCEDSAGLGISLRPHSDIYDAILRAKGEDPLAARKRRFLRLTRELRDKLGDDYRGKVLSRSKLKAGRHLERVWTDRSRSFPTKRRQLFGLWDESEEPTSPNDDRPEAKAGQRARGHIITFIRAKLPAGSPEAYGEAELRRLNAARSSRQAFEPYR